MHFQLILICLCIYFCQVILVTATTKWIATFKVSRRNPNINRCASEHVSKKEFSGFLRVFESTGQCEGLSGPWDEKTLEAGYGYAQILIKKENSMPANTMESQDEVYLNFPIVFTTGTSYSVYVTWPKIIWDMISLSLYKESNGEKVNSLHMSINDDKYFKIFEPSNYSGIEYPIDDKLQGSDGQISFVANGNNAIEILFNGKSMIIWKGQSARFNLLGTLKIYYRSSSDDKGFQIHGSEYRKGNSYLTK